MSSAIQLKLKVEGAQTSTLSNFAYFLSSFASFGHWLRHSRNKIKINFTLYEYVTNFEVIYH